MKIAFIGAGNMAEAFCRGLLKNKVVSAKDLCASDVRPARDIPWLKACRVWATDSLTAARASEVVFFSVKPKDMAQVLGETASGLKPPELKRKLFVSIAAGLPLRKLEEMLGKAARVVRVMPNTPALVGMGASAYCLGSQATAKDGRRVEGLLRAVGLAVRVGKDSDLDGVTALSGSGPAYYFRLLEEFHAAGCKAGLEASTAFRLAVQTWRGAAEMASRAGDLREVALLRAKVTSPGGTTEAGLKVMEGMGLGKMMEAAVLSAKARARELGKLA
jgi:pyrroline-5-carboxylate reductase